MTSFKVGDFYYITTEESEVTIGKDTMDIEGNALDSNSNYYKNIFIQKHVNYNGKTYSVTRVGHKALNNARSNKVFIANTIKSIGMHAFTSDYITSVIFEEGSVCTSIGAWGFMIYNKNFKRIVFPPSISNIGSYVFCCLAAQIDVYYCGSNTLNPSGILDEDISKIKAHVSSKYPKNEQFLKVDPVETNADCKLQNPYIITLSKNKINAEIYLLIILLIISI